MNADLILVLATPMLCLPRFLVLSVAVSLAFGGLAAGQTLAPYHLSDDSLGGPPLASPHVQPDIAMEAVFERLQYLEATVQALQDEIESTDATEADGDDYTTYSALSQSPAADAKESKPAAEKPKEKKWYDKIGLRGYAQFRINETYRGPDSAPPQHAGDRSVGDNQNFLIRRARIILSGDVSDHMAIYLQPDFASNVPGSPDATFFAQIRDWYADCYFDKTKVYRVRVGQSKIPFGWENLQSSSNRLPLDRSDALNSAVRNERDLGAFFYWTPEYAQDFFKEVVDLGLKGSGNYGVFGAGVYNGQGGSFVEQNENLHFVTRLTLPYVFDNCQRMEIGVQGYTGMYTVLSSQISPLGVGPLVRPAGTLETGDINGHLDERVAGSFIWYPQPFGFQVEWNVGEGPALNDAQTEVVVRPLSGGYVMALYMHETACHGTFFPFTRYVHYRGGYKPERNAPYSFVDEWELGLEWQINKQMELTAMYTWTDRTNTVARSTAGVESYEQFEGQIARFQFQVNY